MPKIIKMFKHLFYITYIYHKKYTQKQTTRCKKIKTVKFEERYLAENQACLKKLKVGMHITAN